MAKPAANPVGFGWALVDVKTGAKTGDDDDKSKMAAQQLQTDQRPASDGKGEKISRAISLLKASGGFGSKSGLKPIKVWLTNSYAMSGANNANAFPTQSLTPIGTQDYSGFAALYDMVRVIAIEAHAIATYTGAVPSGGHWALAWDPANFGAYSSINDVLSSQKFIGPIVYSGINTAAGGTGTASFTNTGFHTLRVKLPAPKEQIVNDNTSPAVVGGGWIATSETTYYIGVIKAAITALGTGATSALSVYVRYFCEFASRT